MTSQGIYLNEVESTNLWLRSYKSSAGEDLTFVWTDFQTAGRGCGRNTWESEDGKNLIFSVLCHPRQVSARQQFILSMANALALKDTLDSYLGEVKIKWPNDIYWQDKKICGTLIETVLHGNEIKDCILGTGINVNQQAFRSQAPNPVSMCQILGHEVNREDLLAKVREHLEEYLEMVDDGMWESLRANYRQALYRLQETHPFRLPDGRVVSCKVMGVDDDGHILLLPEPGQAVDTRPIRFAFKEVQFII